MPLPGRRRPFPAGLVPALFLALTTAPALAQENHGMERSGFHADFLADLENLESKFLDLADAMSSAQYAWRPMDGVRSVSEVFMLIVAENYVIPSYWGAKAPEGMTVDGSLFGGLAAVTDKDEVGRQLRASFAYYKEVTAALSESDLNRTIQFFGRERTVSQALFGIAADMHEHLGQAIAYARANHVVPPWTARRQGE